MSDHSELSLQGHEISYILRKFRKRTTEENIATLKILEKQFKLSKGATSTKDYTKDEFYEWLLGENLDELD